MSSVSTPWPVLREGSRGPNITALQHLLTCARDMWRLTPDGVYGPKTAETVRAYQGTAGLPVDGVVGPQTWESLTSGRTFGSTVRRGDRGECVKAVQVELNKHNYGREVDGDFGQLTEASVLHFQGVVGLKQDGVVGPLTWHELIGRQPD
jgi:peptidoglycan hydrolase-like protein with peptidoglycan-binding domain